MLNRLLNIFFLYIKLVFLINLQLSKVPLYNLINFIII